LRILIDKHPIHSALPLYAHKTVPYFARLPSIDLHTNGHVRPDSSLLSSAKNGEPANQITALDIFIWADAQAVRSVITCEIAKNRADSIVDLLHWVGNLNSFWLSKVGKEQGEITNIGLWKHNLEDHDGDWKVGRVVFSQCAAESGPAFSVSLSTGGNLS
jgi:hypothetical protein